MCSLSLSKRLFLIRTTELKQRVFCAPITYIGFIRQASNRHRRRRCLSNIGRLRNDPTRNRNQNPRTQLAEIIRGHHQADYLGMCLEVEICFQRQLDRLRLQRRCVAEGSCRGLADGQRKAFAALKAEIA